MNQSPSKRVYFKKEWEKKLSAVKLTKEDMNKLVMNFLVMEGYVDAAQKFHEETGTEPDMDLHMVTDVLKSLECGDVEDAVEKVNVLYPHMLGENPGLSFYVQGQRFIELVRTGNIEEAVKVAQEKLGPRCQEAHQYDLLERMMILLAFEDAASCPVKDLLDVSLRQITAREFNAAILTSQVQERGSKLTGLLKMLSMVQAQLYEVDYPRINDLASAELQLEMQLTPQEAFYQFALRFGQLRGLM